MPGQLSRTTAASRRYASGTALAREAQRIAGERPDSGMAQALADGLELAGPLVTELAHDGDAAAIEAIALIGTRLGVAIASLVNIFNPEVVVIGGGVIAAGELLLDPARAESSRAACCRCSATPSGSSRRGSGSRPGWSAPRRSRSTGSTKGRP